MGLLPGLLDACGASDDHLEALIADIAVLETRIGAGSANNLLHLEFRRGCADAFRVLLQNTDAPMPSWFHAMSLLDLYCHSEGRVDHRDIPCVCIAIAIIIAKLEGACTSKIVNLVNSNEQMFEVYRKEKDILDVLQFRTRIPTIASWLNIFLPRLRLTIIDPKLFVCISHLVMCYSQHFATQNVCLPDSLLQHFAQGLIGVACIATARISGWRITQLREAQEAIQVPLLSCMGADIDTLEEDCDTVNHLLFGMPRVSQQRSFLSI